MTFSGMLFSDQRGKVESTPGYPDFFKDLNLDQVVDELCTGKEEYDLKPFFCIPLHDPDMVLYRQEIMRDLENEGLFALIQSFAGKMREVRGRLAQAEKLRVPYQKKRWFLDAAALYGDAVEHLHRDLSHADLKSQGFLAFREYLTAYAAGSGFKSLVAEARSIQAELATIRYCLWIKGSRITVKKYENEADYGIDVDATFAKFKIREVEEYQASFPPTWDMNHVEAGILERVARLYPDVFADFDVFCEKNVNFLDAAIVAFDREIQFYIAFLDFMARFRKAGLKFCYPQLSLDSKDIHDYEGFDAALALKLIKENSPIVCNDFYLRGRERIVVVTGPNQGGKTTFARAFGQMHYLAGIGCPVPGKEARLFLCDRLFTHFGKEAEIKDLYGKLFDDVARIHDILDRATPRSIVLINEIFTSTTLHDAVFLSRQVMEKIKHADLLCVWVTFIDELASAGDQVVSMVSQIVPDNPSSRTFKIVRKPADGLSYAIAIAEKYRMTYEQLKDRLP